MDRPRAAAPAAGRASKSPNASLDSVVTAAEIEIVAMTAGDWESVARIYAAGIAAGDATFEHTVPSWEQWARARVSDVLLVARGSPAGPGGAEGVEDVLGWAALSPVSARQVYRGVAEVSIYVEPAFVRRGIGGALLRALIDASERAGFWALHAGIFPENTASVALHERCGFRFVGVYERVGQMSDGRWRDVALYERRSLTVGQG